MGCCRASLDTFGFVVGDMLSMVEIYLLELWKVCQVDAVTAKDYF